MGIATGGVTQPKHLPSRGSAARGHRRNRSSRKFGTRQAWHPRRTCHRRKSCRGIVSSLFVVADARRRGSGTRSPKGGVSTVSIRPPSRVLNPRVARPNWTSRGASAAMRSDALHRRGSEGCGVRGATTPGPRRRRLRRHRCRGGWPWRRPGHRRRSSAFRRRTAGSCRPRTPSPAPGPRSLRPTRSRTGSRCRCRP